MGGQDTKVNLVPPGGSGWGTGSSNNLPDNESKSDLKPTAPTTSILKDITEVPEQESDDSKEAARAKSPVALVKPPQKPFFAPRSSKPAPIKSSNDDSSDSRSLAGKSTGPTIPFYHRPSTTPLPNSIPIKDPEVSKANVDEKPFEVNDVSNDIATPLTGWAALTTEETDFQERINFSDDDEKETSKPSLDKICNKLPKASWVSTPMQPPAPVPMPYPRTVWDQPSCFNPGSPMQHTFHPPFRGPNDGVFGEPSPIPSSHLDVLPNRDVVLLADQFQRTTFTTSEAQLQAQREERTLAFKSAVNRAQMARKKRIEFEAIEPKQKDQSIDSTRAFSIHGPVSHSPQHHNVEPVVDALYSNGLSNLMHSVAFGNSPLPSHLANDLPPWNPGSYSANSQPSFLHHSYSLSNSSKLPTDQGFYFNSDHFTMNAFSQQPNSKGGHVQSLQSDHSTEKPVHSYARTMEESKVVNHLSFQPTRSHISQQPPASPILENRMESEIDKELLAPLPRAVVINHPIQISAHPDGSRTAFTPPIPPTVESFPPQNLQPQPMKQQQQPHITPLMEVNISGKWSEKDFDTYAPMSSSKNYIQSFKSICGFAKNANDEKAGGNRFASLSSNGGHYRGSAPRDSKIRSTRRAVDLKKNRIDEQSTEVSAVGSSYEGQQGYSNRQRCDDVTSDTFPRQQRVRGPNRIPRSNRAAPDYDECQQNVDLHRQQSGSYNHRDAWKGGSNGYKNLKKGDNVIGKAGSVITAGSGRGRKKVCAGGRRYVGNEYVSKPGGHYSTQRSTDEDIESVDTAVQNDTDNADCNVFSDSEQGTSTLQPTGVDMQCNSQRHLGRGNTSGRARRGGQHGGSQRQPQRRDRTDRANTRRPNNRRHPDDDDHDYKGGPSNGNATSAASATTTTAGGCNTNRGQGKTNTDSHGNTTSNGQQQNGSVDAVQSLGVNVLSTAVKSRNHVHSVTLTSDVEVWETASEGFSSSLLGTSPCSFDDCASASPTSGTAKSADHKDLTDDDYEEGGYNQSIKKPVLSRSTPKIAGEIVPLMSINAEAPSSYCDNLSFLDPLIPLTSKLPASDSHPVEPITVAKNIGSTATCTSSSSEDGVCSQSGKGKQTEKVHQKNQKSSAPSDERLNAINTTNRNFGTSHGKMLASSATDKKSSKLFKNDEISAKDKFSTSATSSNSSQAPQKHSESVGKKITISTLTQPVNAWLKPLQETINEKAVSTVSSTKTVVPTTASSYAWSVVVGSRANTNTLTGCAPTEKMTMSLIAEVDENAVSKPSEGVSSHPSTVPIARNPPSLPNMPAILDSSAIPQTRQSKLDQTLPQDEGIIQISDPSSVSTSITSTATTTSANVCKVRPQKQPTNAVLVSSSTPPIAHASKSESISLPISTAYSAPGNAVLINPSQLRRPIGDFGDWLGKNSGAYTSNSSSVFFDGFRNKKIEAGSESSLRLTPAAAAAAAALYLHQQQQHQPFRQTLQPLQQQQSMMGFGLPELTMRHQNNPLSGGCSQSGMGTDNYFTAPFGAGGSVQAGSQQPPPRGLYPPATPTQQRGFPSWQQQQHHSQQEAAVMAAAVAGAVAPQAAALWSSNYTPPPLPPHHPPYVGVIGADRPSSTSITSRLQSGNASAMLYGSGSMRGGSRAPSGVGGAPFGQTAPPPPSGLYASSPTPPPPIPYDPTFAYTSGGIPNSSNVFAHQSGAMGTPALLAASHHHSGSAHSIGDPSHTSHPPVFINASHAPFPAAPATISVHGLVGPTAPLTTHGLHF